MKFRRERMSIYPAELSGILEFLGSRTLRQTEIPSWKAWKAFKEASLNDQWVYVYAFANDVIAWGTATGWGSGDRLRKAGMFHTKLTGKYDRRVDYLMLKQMYGMPKVFVFETSERATEVEGALRRKFNQRHCYRGIYGADRTEISNEIVRRFRLDKSYASLSVSDRQGFERYLSEVFFANRRHPENPSRTFYWGDSLEPGFLRTIGVAEIELAVEKALGVSFYDERATHDEEAA